MFGERTWEPGVSYKMVPIGYAHTRFKFVEEIPKGIGAKHEELGEIEILEEYQEGLIDIEGFSHIYVLWVFHVSKGWELTVVPPNDDRPHGVFATRSPFRPNPIGLTVVRLLRRDGRMLHVKGVDMLDGSPVLDIKPYLSNVGEDELRRGWVSEAESRAASESVS